MTVLFSWFLAPSHRLAAVGLFTLVVGGLWLPAIAQERPPASTTDPRATLKAGFKDAGVAARHMELLANLPKPDGFFDPEMPAGAVSSPEPPPGTPPPQGPPGGTPAAGNATPPAPPRGSGFTNSDLAFSGNHAIVGNYHGFNTYDIENARRPRLLASIVCPGGQGDVSIHGNLLFMSVEQTRGRIDCGTEGVSTPVSAERFRGVRIFDISDLRKPKQVAAVQTCRGSHTHTLVTAPGDAANLYIYGSGTGPVRSTEELAECSGKDWKEDPSTALFSIDVIKVPLAAPEKAAIVNRPRIFADEKTGSIGALWQGGNHGPGTQTTRLTNQCHDITVYPEIGLAAGACAGNGILMDISDPVHPVRLDAAVDPNFAYWHSATFNNDGTKIVFTDEWGGGGRPRCRATDPPTWGANAIFDIVDRKLQFGGYYKLPAAQTEQENCVAHNGSLIPVPGRDIMVQAWYQGGVTVFDFTDSANATEIAYFDRGPIDAKQLVSGGYWSSYWYNGHVYGAEIARGIDVFRLTPSEHLSQNEIEAATLVRFKEFNSQQQPKVTWPATSVVARAYLDQLGRSKGLGAERARAIRAALERADRARAGTRAATDATSELQALAAQVETSAAAATGRDQSRLRALAETLKGRAERLR
ncbi:MAG: LVIVD repeat-containing protein [Acidobacteriota bacterium]